ncbi:MAG: hypothetical protein Q9179_003372 [Wetmoreana sp. 5 TL-2023]
MPRKPLPFPTQFADVDEYIDSALSFITSSQLFQRLCGGVHILEFLTRDPDLHATLLPSDWRLFFKCHDVSDILDLLLRDSVTSLEESVAYVEPECEKSERYNTPRPRPPASLLEYIRHVRRHSLDRTVHLSEDPSSRSPEAVLTRHVAIGMKPKKIHEVSNLVRYVDRLSLELLSNHSCQINQFVDFGSGQNYLGRALASPPHDKKVIALESKPLNIDGARSMDVTAKLSKKEVVIRNKKQYRGECNGERRTPGTERTSDDLPSLTPTPSNHAPAKSEETSQAQEGNIQYVETIIRDGDLSSILSRLNQPSTAKTPNLMVISLHSCGNLLHHGLRSLILNPSVRAVALVGCCYNLLTERLPLMPPSALSSHPSTLRSAHPRLQKTSSACDPHGFPMSERFATYDHANGPGIRFNITARMMAVQAPGNWTEKDYESFFTRHFYRALFQKILVDKGVVDAKVGDPEDIMGKRDHEGIRTTHPIILGSLRKRAYVSFAAYVRAAIEKLKANPVYAVAVTDGMDGLTDDEILEYEEDYGHKKKELSIIWSLMAFSAGVVESMIVADRWQWLREQKEVRECWVENIFDYSISPRNLVVVGIKR